MKKEKELEEKREFFYYFFFLLLRDKRELEVNLEKTGLDAVLEQSESK